MKGTQITTQMWSNIDKIARNITVGLGIEVIHQDMIETLMDIHFNDDTLCYISDNGGFPIQKEKLTITVKGLKTLQTHMKFNLYR